jgi:hypothetical protein
MGKTKSEAELQQKIQRQMRDMGCYVFKNHGNMYTEGGRPDLVACVPTSVETLEQLLKEENSMFRTNFIGVFVALEIKRENRLNELSQAQRIVGDNIRKAGGIWFAIDDADLAKGIVLKLKGELK